MFSNTTMTVYKNKQYGGVSSTNIQAAEHLKSEEEVCVDHKMGRKGGRASHDIILSHCITL